ncbi:MAG: hypothetical protein F6K19_13750 [Cyanothece sp. SIO1E1]|nr:hypothetical protein [Cyanothece sp. SIO1E1]
MNTYDRAAILSRYGAAADVIEELLHYNQNPFQCHQLNLAQHFPLASEPHVTTWEMYRQHAQAEGVLATLRDRLVQLQFPIQAGMSQKVAYRAATRKGQPTTHMPEATGLVLQQPGALQLLIYPSLAGKIPVIMAECRDDFVALVQALTMRNEPHPIPDSMGALTIAGYNNWDRIRHYRAQWERNQRQLIGPHQWQAEFKRLIPQTQLYQDCFILLSRGNYSGVAAADMGLAVNEWQQLSFMIRLEHECTHYFTRRWLHSMRNNILDELIADYQGIVVATQGRYHADWFLRFMGLEAFPSYRVGGRLENYRGQPPLSDQAFKILQALVKDAAVNLASFNVAYQDTWAEPRERALLLMALTSLSLEELANLQENALVETWQRFKRAIAP